MSNPQLTISSNKQKEPSSSPYDFSNFQMGAAGAVIAILLKMSEIDLEIGQLQNTLAALNNNASITEANATSELQKDQGTQQKIDQILSGTGEIAGGALSIGGAIGGEIYFRKASQNLSEGEKYLKPVDKPQTDKVASNQSPENLPKDFIENPEVKKRIQQMKTEIDITQSPDQVKKVTIDGREISDADILKFAKNEDVEKIQAQAKSQIDKRTNEIKDVGEKINLLTPGLQHMLQGSFSLAAANRKEVAKDDEAQATIAQNLTSLFNSNQSVLQGQSTSTFGLITAFAQYIDQLVMANKYNGG
ncbi:hypothetical protein [Simkania negevensis]|uniref:Uncharacterized protein n=1 Tax=Simkania negevensis (strain ATCC VR-1471 / DSM 27360 / Z) TaxID=331113 RepID=F8L922_SIMNZ|nr:hypothetical protein [Simkania negevensis]CCB89335.1 unknown protein [Simkania negevensis Z]